MAESTVTNIAQLLDRYRSFAAARREETVDDFRRRFTSLQGEFEKTKSDAQERARKYAPGFNIFSLLGVQTKERQTHSALLAELLDPSGSHGQQHHFLRHFLAHCQARFGSIFAVKDIENSEWEVHTEYSARTLVGRLDILIRNPELGVQFVIENKIYAGEQPAALRRYADWLALEEEAYPQQALLYLTRHGDESETHGGADYYRLSYQDDIKSWLEAALEDVEASRVKEIVHQYRDLIEALSGGIMSIEKDLEEFLAQPGNLRTALEIEKHVRRMRDRYHAAFWPKVEEELGARLDASPHAERWYLKKLDLDYRNAGAGRSLAPRLRISDPVTSRLKVTFNQGSAGQGFPLNHGIHWTGSGDRKRERPEYQALQAYLLQRGNQVRNSGGWVYVASSGYNAGGDRFMLRMASEPELFIGELVELQWVLFEDTVEYLDAFNEAVTMRET